MTATTRIAHPTRTLALGHLGAGPDERAHRESVVRVRIVLGVIVTIWVASGLLDWLVVTMTQGGQLGRLLALRGVGALVLLAVFVRLSLSPLPTPRGLLWLDLGAYTTATIVLSLMCLVHGGIDSPYAHGVTFLLVVRGVGHPTPWRQGVALLGIPALAHPLTLLVVAAWSPVVGAQFRDGRLTAAFVQDVLFALMTAGALVVSKHLVWNVQMQLRAARMVGRYQLKRELGRGGMGSVWLAHDRSLRRDVAIKILRPDVAHTPGNLERFEREVRATAELSHPNSVRLFDHGVTEDGLWFYAMELLEGETLGAILHREGLLSVRRAVSLVLQAAQALAEAHAKGIVHRDVKPENLFVCRGEPEQVKLIDFGIARVVSTAGAGSALTGVGWILGTPSYMSPEQVAGLEVTPASDVYSLGAVLYTCLTGRPPFEASSPSQVMAGHVSEPVLPPSLRTPLSLPLQLERIVLQCLAKHPLARFQDAGELARALQLIEASEEPPCARAPSGLPSSDPTLRLVTPRRVRERSEEEP